MFRNVMSQNRNTSVSSVLYVLLTLGTSVVCNTGIFYGSRFDPYHHEVVLGPENNFTLEWRIDWKSRSVLFNISAECKGYIGLGLSRRGEIPSSDFVIGGVSSTGSPYISDMHGMPDGTLQEDHHQDWTLISANRSGGSTHLSFSRQFDTCDDEDFLINEDLINIIWLYGDTDEITLFTPHLGRFKVYLLDPDPSEDTALDYYRQIGPHSNLYLMQRWRVSTRQKLLPKRNFQICTIVNGLPLVLPHNVLGGGAYIPHEAEDHVRQIVLSKCTAPVGSNATTYFERFVNSRGEECTQQTSPTLPRQLCNEKIFVWGQGGRPFYFPNETGIPIGASPNEYFMLEIQYFNPERITDLEVKAGFDLLIHPRPLRDQGGILTIGYKSGGQFVIPPRSSSFTIYGHCSPQCTQRMLSTQTFDIFAALIQMRSFGRTARIRHFRNGIELPWILKDGNYDGTFQQARMLPTNITVLPGDQLTVECTFDTLKASNGTYSGFSTDTEQCVAHLFVNKLVTTSDCTSEYPSNVFLGRLGIQNTSRILINPRRIVIPPSPSNQNQFAVSIEKNVQWTPEIREDLQREMAQGSHVSSCPSNREIVAQTTPGNSATRRRGGNGAFSPSVTPIPSSRTGFVTLPDISSPYRKSSECQRIGHVDTRAVEAPNAGLIRLNPNSDLDPFAFLSTPVVGSRSDIQAAL